MLHWPKKSLVMPFYYINFDQNGPPYSWPRRNLLFSAFGFSLPRFSSLNSRKSALFTQLAQLSNAWLYPLMSFHQNMFKHDHYSRVIGVVIMFWRLINYIAGCLLCSFAKSLTAVYGSVSANYIVMMANESD